MRIADPDGAWMPHPDDARLLVPVPPAGPPPGTSATGCSTRARSSTTTASRSRRPARPRGSTSTATSRPGGAPASAGPATTRCPSRRSTPSCGPSSPARTCAATTPSTPAAACCCARRRRSPTRPCRRATCGRGSSSARSAPRSPGYPVHSVYEDFTWDKSDTMSGAADDWAYEHLGVYSLDHRVLGRRPRGDRARRRHGLLVRRPDRRAGARRAALDRRARARASSSTGTRSSTRSSAPSSWAAGTYLGHLDEPAARPAARPRSPPHAAFAVAQALASPCLAIRHHGGRRPRRRHVADRGRHRQQRVAADAGVGAGRRNDLVRPIVAEVGGRASPSSAARPAAARPARGPGAMRFTVRPRRHARPRARHRGSCRPSRAPRSRSRSATTAPARGPQVLGAAAVSVRISAHVRPIRTETR